MQQKTYFKLSMVHQLKSNFIQLTLGLYICFLLGSCKQSKPDLIGKCTGKPILNCPLNMFSSGFTAANYEFLNDGICKFSFEGNSGSEDAIVVWPESRYELIKDSLILIFKDSVNARLAYTLELKDNNKIILSRFYTNPETPNTQSSSVTELSRVDI